MDRSMDASTERRCLLCCLALCLSPSNHDREVLENLCVILNVSKEVQEEALSLMLAEQEQDAGEGGTMLERAEESKSVEYRILLDKEAALRGWSMILLICLRSNQFVEHIAKQNKNKVSMTTMSSFDAKASVILRRLAYLLRIRLDMVCALEELALFELEREARVYLETKVETVSEQGSKFSRNLKIGAAATAAGGLLAFTGGLAAPALAYGLGSLGLGAAAAVTTSATVATILGAGGAGLGAYKMSRRVRGIQFFSIDSINETHDDSVSPNAVVPQGMTIYVCISGFLRKPRILEEEDDPDKKADSSTAPDFYGPWGATMSYPSSRETLQRFYEKVAPEKLAMLDDLVDESKGKEEEFYSHLHKMYGINPKSMITPQHAQQRHHFDSAAAENGEIYREVLRHAAAQLDSLLKNSDSLLTDDIPDLSNLSIHNLFNNNLSWETSHNRSFMAMGSEASQDSASDEPMSQEEILKVAAEVTEIMKNETPNSQTRVDSDTSDSVYNESLALDSDGCSYWWRQEIARYGDQYTVRFEPDILLDVGQALKNLIKEGMSRGVQELLTKTALNAILAAITLPMQVVSLVNGLDESWVMATKAADQAGRLLADALLSGAGGSRPVVLVGYGIGGRVVASCLSTLAKVAYENEGCVDNGSTPIDMNVDNQHEDTAAAKTLEASEDLIYHIENRSKAGSKERIRRLRAATLVRDAVVIGAPCDASKKEWTRRRSVVVGRLVNVYNPKDWILALLYRYKSWDIFAIAGLQKVNAAPSSKYSRVENYNVSEFIHGHLDYASKIDSILKHISFGDVDCEEAHFRYFNTGKSAVDDAD